MMSFITILFVNWKFGFYLFTDIDTLYPRSGHRAVTDDSDMYVLGGYNPRFREVENSTDTYYPLFKEVNTISCF